MSSRAVLRLLLLLAAAAALAGAAMTLQQKRQLAISTVDDIEDQLAALDPVTRAAVIARLGKDATETVRAR
jgi:hypothetical protein